MDNTKFTFPLTTDSCAEAIEYTRKLVVKERLQDIVRTQLIQDPLFCRKLSEDNSLLSSLLSAIDADKILHQYYRYGKFSPELEGRISEIQPKLFVENIRSNRAFLKEERQSFYSTVQLPDDLIVHKEVWLRLANAETERWNKVESKINDLIERKIPIETILGDVCKLVDGKIFPPEILNKNAEAYNIFIVLVLKGITENHPDYDLITTKSKKQNKLLKRFDENINNPIESLVNDAFQSIFEWTLFKDSFLNPYCYDHNFTPKNENGIISLKYDPYNFYRWSLDGVRYDLLKGFYGVMAPNIDSIEELLKDIGVEDIRYYKTHSKEKTRITKVSEYFKPLLFISLFTLIDNSAFFLFEKKEFIQTTSEKFDNISTEVYENIIDSLSFSVNPNTRLDRFSNKYNVWEKPFIRVGSLLFCPSVFLLSNDWFYSAAQIGLGQMSLYRDKSKNRECITKPITKRAEELIKKALSQNGWNSRSINVGRISYGKAKGDVDIYVEDKEVSLLIQLKTTSFKLDLEKAYYEENNASRKAVEQLNNAEKYLIKSESGIKLKSKVVKWYVSTSYENVFIEQNGCLKINYFDLLLTLRATSFGSLDQFISTIENDTIGKANLSDQLPMLDPENFEQVLWAINETAVGMDMDYRTSYNRALEFQKAGDHDQALKTLHKLLGKKEDFSVHFALANCYADIQQFDNSYVHFEKALQYLPDDPYLLKHYHVALKGGGRNEKAQNILDRLIEKYWFVNLG